MTHWDGRTIGDQDREILRMIGEGKQQTEIATALRVSKQAIRFRVKVWEERGWVDPAKQIPAKLTAMGVKGLRKAER